MASHSQRHALLAVLTLWCASCHVVSAARVAIIGGGVGGTAAAHFLRKDQPGWHIELFERERLGGRAQEVELDGKVLELGASIIHGANQYMLGLARDMNLTLTAGDDTGAAFSIWNGRDFVFSQGGNTLTDVWAVIRRYGVSPLRYGWLSKDAGQRFGGIYPLQQQGVAFTRPENWLQQLGLLDHTQQSTAGFMQEHLTRGWWSFGAAAFSEELAGAINRINYNQNNSQLNALAGLVSYLPAADPKVYSIAEGNAALPRQLAKAAKLQGLHIGVTVQAITRGSDGRFTLDVLQSSPADADRAASTDADTAAAAAAVGAEIVSDGEDALQLQHGTQQQAGGLQQPSQQLPQQQQQQQPQQVGRFDAVIVATPLEGSGLQLRGLDQQPPLPARSYQQTTTSFITGFLDAAFFDKADIPDGDVFVTNSAQTPFTVVASKGTVSAAAVAGCCPGRLCAAQCAAGIRQQLQRQQQQQQKEGPEQQQPQQQQGEGPEQIPLWKVFSDDPLSWHTLRTLFVNGTVVASRSWAAYPKFDPPERFAPFLLAPRLCYNNALENAASAMEVAAVAGRNCALLVQQQLRQGLEKVATS